MYKKKNTTDILNATFNNDLCCEREILNAHAQWSSF